MPAKIGTYFAYSFIDGFKDTAMERFMVEGFEEGLNRR